MFNNKNQKKMEETKPKFNWWGFAIKVVQAVVAILAGAGIGSQF